MKFASVLDHMVSFTFLESVYQNRLWKSRSFNHLPSEVGK
jgi:hypothetical protein